MLKYLIIASICWFNPLVSNIDILPDLIGYLLVLKAFSKASYVFDNAADLCSSARKMCIVSGVKMLTVFMVSSLDVTMSLLLSFTFLVIELIFGIPFFLNLFKAVMYYVPVENMQSHQRENGAKQFTIIALISRLFLAFLPDLTALSLDGAFSYDTDLSYLRFRPLFIVLSVIISLAISTIWLIKFIRFLYVTVTKSVDEKYNSESVIAKNNNKALIFAKNNIRALVLVAIGSLFIFDFTWEYTSADIFQDFVLALVTVASLLYLAIKKIYRIDKFFYYLLGAFVMQLFADVFETVANVKYFEKYNLQSINSLSKAERLYSIVSWSALASVVTLVASTLLILVVLKKNARNEINNNSKLFSEIDIDYYLKEYDRRISKRIITVFAISILYSVVYVLSVSLKLYAEWLVLLNSVLEIVYIIAFISAILYIYDEVYKRIVTFA